MYDIVKKLKLLIKCIHKIQIQKNLHNARARAKYCT